MNLENKLVWEIYGYTSLLIVFITVFFKLNNNTQGKLWLTYGLAAIVINLILKLRN